MAATRKRAQRLVAPAAGHFDQVSQQVFSKGIFMQPVSPGGTPAAGSKKQAGRQTEKQQKHMQQSINLRLDCSPFAECCRAAAAWQAKRV
jgi:hypothetical protein